jgi:hypothetical protein
MGVYLTTEGNDIDNEDFEEVKEREFLEDSKTPTMINSTKRSETKTPKSFLEKAKFKSNTFD